MYVDLEIEKNFFSNGGVLYHCEICGKFWDTQYMVHKIVSMLMMEDELWFISVSRVFTRSTLLGLSLVHTDRYFERIERMSSYVFF